MRAMFKNPVFPLIVSLSRSTGVIFGLTQEQFSSQTEFRHNKHSQTQLHSEESLFFVDVMMMATLVTAGVSKRCRFRLSDVAWSTSVGNMWKTRCQLVQLRCKIQALLTRSRWVSTARQSLQVSLGATCASNPEDVTLHIGNSRKWMPWCHNFSLITATWETEALHWSLASSWEQTPLLEPSMRQWCQTPRMPCMCEGCLVVRSGHGPQAEVAQGVGPEPLVEL